MNSQVALIRCPDYSASRVEAAVRQAVGLLGGIDKFIKPNSRVLIKPNLLSAREPESAVVTHPQVVRAVIHLLKDINAQIYIGDSPSAWHGDKQRIQQVWEKSGINQVAQEEAVELIEFTQRRRQKQFFLTTWLDNIDFLISLPKFKTHDITVLTAAMKNCFGLIPGRYKIELHRRYFTPYEFSKMLVDLYEIVRPNLTIVDGILALEGEGPGSRGHIREAGLIAAGVDCVSIDSILACIMGLKPSDILPIKEAAKRNLGNAGLENIQILGDKLDTFIGKPFKLPVNAFKYRISSSILGLLKDLIRFYPSIDSRLCSRCEACIETCPEKVIKNKNGKIIIDYSGCIFCFCCKEACPQAAIGTKRSLIARLLKL